ncbi:MAG: hypothetical protein ACLP1X_20870, partial [Polyangiaceae bacterium]
DAASVEDSAQGGPSASEGDSDEAGIFNCAWINGPNCWKTAVASATGCLPSALAKGTLSADGMTCTYPSGTIITFSSPVVPGPSLMSPTNFVVITNGVQCLRYTTGADSDTVTLPAGPVTFSGQADGGVRVVASLTCPDGTTYSGPAAPLASCQDSFPYLDLGEGFSRIGDAGYTGTAYSYLNGAGGDAGEITVFTCASP